MTSDPVRITVFGLGEAGNLIAGDLATAGAEVKGYDPAPVPTPRGVIRHDDPESAVDGADLILAVTAALDAPEALRQGLDSIRRGAIYADLSTAAPGLKEKLADTCRTREISFVDVALMATVPGNGLPTPSLASGPGAARYAEVVNGLGGRADAISETPGDAAGRKLLRSVVTKGLTALIVESLEAAHERGDTEWLWHHIVKMITDADETLLRRFLTGTSRHVDRRIEEMDAALTLLQSRGVPSPMTSATVESLGRIKTEGLPLDVDADL